MITTLTRAGVYCYLNPALPFPVSKDTAKTQRVRTAVLSQLFEIKKGGESISPPFPRANMTLALFHVAGKANC